MASRWKESWKILGQEDSSLEACEGIPWPRHLRNELSEAKGVLGTRMNTGKFPKTPINEGNTLPCLIVGLLRSAVTDYPHFNPRAHMSAGSYRVQSHQDNSRSGMRSHNERMGCFWGAHSTTRGGTLRSLGTPFDPSSVSRKAMGSRGDGRT